MSWVTLLIDSGKKVLGITKSSPYADMYLQAVVKPEKLFEVQGIVKKINEGKSKYEDVAATLGNGIHWWFIGVVHFMEAGLFYPNHSRYHLHCGDTLTGRTTHIPKGRPKANPGNGKFPPSSSNPYSWKESALDALSFMGYDKIKDWSIENCLNLFEKYNGLGYKKRGLPSPYLWSYTQYYVKGKYTLDGKYDPEAVSKQSGVAAILKVMGIS